MNEAMFFTPPPVSRRMGSWKKEIWEFSKVDSG